MAEEVEPQPSEAIPPAEDMDVEASDPAVRTSDGDDDSGPHAETNSKREREGPEDDEDGASKKQKAEEKSVEEKRLEKAAPESGRVKLGPKEFESSVEMVDYFFKFIHQWPVNISVNKYEHMVLLDLVKKGHPEPDKKMGSGVIEFQVRFHPMWKSKCFFVVREDKSVDDFSYKKCVDHILPLPEEMKAKQNGNKALGGGWKGRGGKAGGGGGGRGRGRGRGGN